MNILSKIIAISTFDYAHRFRGGDYHQPLLRNTHRTQAYAAVAGLLFGCVLALAGAISLSASASFGLAGLFFGTAAVGTAIATLAAMPESPKRR